ncbi:lanthionine synthetase LanC family protein [Streptomyces stelliscabiei]|uniref:lanthionine synthetase LanC family protein n=1 Tax=Streptomyces stelliscabiei TaxID=146820 RepID=UPI002FF0D624
MSSSVGCAPEVLDRCIAILGAHGIAFKHAADLARLSFLSTGRAGPTQVGKFLTAYPPDEATAAEIAGLLHAATAGLSGPRIPNEQPFAAGSLVYSRYGSFARRWVQLPHGRIARALRTPEGWQVDDRTQGGGDWAAKSNRVLRGTYVCINRIFDSPKGNIQLGVVDDADGGALVLVKEVYAHTMEDLTGHDARSRLANEARFLALTAPLGIAPKLVDYWDDADSSFLVYAPIPGPTLAAILSDLAMRGLRPSPDLLRSWTESLCTAVTKLHDAGYVNGDIKPPNIIMTAAGLRLIDFELAGPPTTEPTAGMGTPGYCSPQQTDPACGRSTLDDVYAIGATLLAMATQTDISLLPNPLAVSILEASRAPAEPVYGVIARCLDPDPQRRFPSADAIAVALTSPPLPIPAPPDTPEALALAVEIGDRLLSMAVSQTPRQVHWLSNHPTIMGQPSRDLYAGSSGTALYLCELATATNVNTYLDAALRCGTWLWETEPVVPRKEPMPGLYFGECGPALLYLRLYRATGDPTWRDRARSVSQSLRDIEVRSPDLMTGLAGVGLFHLALWHTCGDEVALQRAMGHATELLRRRDYKRPTWRMPENYEGLSRREFAGFSHGSAGVGYFLAECSLALGNNVLGAASQDVADWVVGLGQPALNDASGLYWNAIDGSNKAYGTNWCHGAPGIARFLLRAHAVSGDPTHLAAAVRAGRTTAATGSWSGTSQCHGLAGNLDILTDLAQHTGEPEHRAAAHKLGENLITYRTTDGWPSDDRSTHCPDLMVGEAGVGAALLRLADPNLPHLVSCAAFGAICP